jgi:glucose-1-phosphate thymidylyltransferase
MIMLGIIPAAGSGTRIQPLAFSKELLPVGSRMDGARERPRAVSEYIVERMLRAGVTRFCFVISPGKSDILEYYGGTIGNASVAYVVQPEPRGLCDALFRAVPWARPDQPVMVGLPDTIWFPTDAACALPDDPLSFLLFPVEHPELFDAVTCDLHDRVLQIQVKQAHPDSRWIWGAFKMPGSVLHELHALWLRREPRDEYVGTLINEYLAQGGRATAVRAGRTYMDVGTVHGYREAMHVLTGDTLPEAG